VALLSYYILKEGLKIREVVALIISFCGILLLIFGKDSDPREASRNT
jgi:drug/metabolite transporter (DMT)-like permease